MVDFSVVFLQTFCDCDLYAILLYTSSRATGDSAVMINVVCEALLFFIDRITEYMILENLVNHVCIRHGPALGEAGPQALVTTRIHRHIIIGHYSREGRNMSQPVGDVRNLLKIGPWCSEAIAKETWQGQSTATKPMNTSICFSLQFIGYQDTIRFPK